MLQRNHVSVQAEARQAEAKSVYLHDVRKTGADGLPDGEANNDMAIKEIREESWLTIGEYIQLTQPYVWRLLERRYLCYLVDWEKLMQGRPEHIKVVGRYG